ncbi:flagellar biosynthetic protein FliO [Variovorax sp. YR566]|uniref:flagellar biosynthetic protein FliO n=1 Tax=Variovorax sp. YR566 TaxID=3450237 RepID=UPI003F802E13
MMLREPVPWRVNAGKPRLACLAIAVAAALLVPTDRVHAVPDSSATASGGGGAGLPSSIPVKRDGAQEVAGVSSDRWWLAITAAGGLLVFAVIAARRRTASTKLPAGPLWARFGGLLNSSTASQEIQRVSSTRLSPRHSLHVVVWNGQRLLLGCTDQSIQLLAESPSAANEGRMPSTAGSSSVPDAHS